MILSIVKFKHPIIWPVMVVVLLFQPLISNAETNLISNIEDALSQTWQSTDVELFVPINTWHNRAYYSKEKVDSYNEQPWGLGLGKYRYDNEGDWHGIYSMAFLDSHSQIEPAVGYGFQKIWRTSENLRLGLGYSFGVSARKDFNYIPFPYVLPLFSIKYKEVALQSTYIPGGYEKGNILFTWIRWQL